MRGPRALLILTLVLLALTAVSRLAADLSYVAAGDAGSLLYAATFQEAAPDLGLFAGRTSARLNAGALRLEPGEPRRLVYAALGPPVADFDLEVETRAQEGPLDNGFGVLFRLHERRPLPLSSFAGTHPASGLNYYLFMISSDGYYQLQRSLEGEQQVLSTWIPSSAIRQGLNVSNRLRVIARGEKMTFHVNGELLAFCIPHDAAKASTWADGQCLEGDMQEVVRDDVLATGRIALAAQSLRQGGVVLTFDNLLLRSPSPAGPPA